MKRVLLIIIFIVFIIGLVSCRKTEAQGVDILLDSEATFDKNYNSILDYADTNVCAIYKDDTKTVCSQTVPVREYLYISDTPVKFEENEDVFAITKNTRTYQADNGKKTVRVYGLDSFIEQNGQWYETAIGFVSPETYQKVEAQKLEGLSAVIKRLNPFHLYSLKAQDTYYPESGDDSIMSAGKGTWADARDESAGSLRNNGTLYAMACLYEANYYVERTFLNFDTSEIDDGATVESAVFHVTAYDGIDNDNSTCSLYDSTASDPVATTDLDLTTFTNLSDDSYTSNEFNDSADSVFEYDLNATGLAEIDLTGLTKLAWYNKSNDADNSQPSTYNPCIAYSSDETGTTKDPYLELVIAEEEPPVQTSTTTIGFVYPDNMCQNNDLSVVCGMRLHYESSTATPDWVEYDYYHLPFFIWLIICIMSLFIGDRLIKEILIRWRK